MSFILHIETASNKCSVAVSHDNKLLASKESDIKNSHSAVITLFIEEIIKEAGISIKSIDAVAVSKGPGSYTGLRIGMSTAKGLCFALDKPLITLNTLQTMAHRLTQEYIKKNIHIKNHLFCPMLDARRMEVYYALFDLENKEIEPTAAEIITSNFLEKQLSNNKIIFFGDGAEKCKSIINHKNAIFIDDIFPSAIGMVELAFKKFNENQFDDVAYSEPFYLKDFIAGKPNVKGLYANKQKKI